MTMSLSSPVTGSAQAGLTSPTYTLTTDVAPDANGRQYAITALGGTQTGVDSHSISKPFTVTIVRPATFKLLGAVNAITGQLGQVPRNSWKIITRKGVLPLAGQASIPLLIRTFVEVPAGADLADPEDIRAALSLHIGALTQMSSGMGDSCVTGIM